MGKLKVAYLLSSMRRCGPNNQLRNIIGHLDRKRISPFIITLASEEKDSLEPDFRQLGCIVVQLHLSRSVAPFIAPIVLQKQLKKLGIQLVHSQGLRPDILSAYCLKSFPRVATLRNYPYEDYRSHYGKMMGSIVAHIHLAALKRIDSPLTNSEVTSRRLRAEAALDWPAFQNGVDTQLFFPADEVEKIKLRNQYGFPLDRKILLSVGHLSPIKDPELLIRAFLTAQLSGSILVLVGSGELVDACKILAGEHPGIVFAGRRNDLPNWYRMADAFVSASHTEGSPNVVLEALASGLPCLLSNIGPHQYFQHDFSGRLSFFQVGDFGDLCEKLKVWDGESGPGPRVSFPEKLSAVHLGRKYTQAYLDLFNEKGCHE